MCQDRTTLRSASARSLKSVLVESIAHSERQVPLATVSHHVPTVSMIHSPELLPPHPFTTIVADDQQRSDGQPE